MPAAVALCLLSLISQLVGCTWRPAPVKPPRIDVTAAAEGALEMFDGNGDGELSKVEAEACQALVERWERYDEDRDGVVSKEELASRFDKWTSGDTGMMNLRAEVLLRGSPLPDATVELTPYDFLGPHVLPAQGTTDRYGFVFLSIPKELLPASQQGTHGMQVGLYTVAVTHPTRKIAAKYNTQTELSVDLSPLEANSGIRLQLR